mgnify:CR=1 FL=1
MKKWLYLVGFVLVSGGGYLAAAHFSGGAFPTLGLPLGGDLGWLRKTSLSFWEDIQFKDFVKAATYHTPENQADIDIPYLLERLFGVKPEFLDIMETEVVLADIDSTQLRARVKTRLKIKLLLNGRIEDREVMLYFHRKSTDAPWFMELESSLRALKADEDKQH